MGLAHMLSLRRSRILHSRVQVAVLIEEATLMTPLGTARVGTFLYIVTSLGRIVLACWGIVSTLGTSGIVTSLIRPAVSTVSPVVRTTVTSVSTVAAITSVATAVVGVPVNLVKDGLDVWKVVVHEESA